MMGSVKKCREKAKKLSEKNKKLKHKLKHVVLKLKRKYSLGDSRRNSTEDTQNEEAPSLYRTSSVQGFTQIREEYFKRLQWEVLQNLSQNETLRSVGDVEAISLHIEQKALLACMQRSIYARVMADTIREIKCATSTNKVHSVVATAAIPIKSENKHLPSVPDERAASPPPAPVPTPTAHPTEEESQLEAIPLPPRVATVIPTKFITLKKRGGHQTDRLSTKPISRVQPRTKVAYDFENNNSNSLESVEPGLTDFISCEMEESYGGEDRYTDDCVKGGISRDDADESTSHADTFQIENLMHILEGTDEEHVTDVDSRLERIFGLGSNDDPPNETKAESPHTERPAEIRHRPSTSSSIKIWKNERYIFMYKIVSQCARMTAPRFYRTRKVFAQLFGDDSDYEHEDNFNDYETFLASCSRRILPDVAKYVMPYYKQRRICGGSYIFKNLVRCIADSLIDCYYYPSEYEIKTYVDKYFPDGKKYMNVTDVWSYSVD